MPKSNLPFASEFTPSKLDLPKLLDQAHTHAGDADGLQATFQAAYFNNPNTSLGNRETLAYNLYKAMGSYGIIDKQANLTSLGQDLFALRFDPPALFRRLAEHILLHLNGIIFVQCIRDMQAAGDTVDLVTLRAALEERGCHFPRGGKHASMMRLWLEKAGIFSSGWQIDDAKLREVMQLPTEKIDMLADLKRDQRCFLRALINMGGDGPYPANEVERLAIITYGIASNEKSLMKEVVRPIERAGFIVVQQRGRAHSPLVSRTPLLVTQVANPLLEQLDKQIDPKLRALLRRPLADIIANLNHIDRNIKGIALEALAFKIMRLIDLDYVQTRLSGAATGGAEVDLVFESSRLVFSRWQIQCKNTERVDLDDVAKEVGLTHLLKSNVIVVVSTGRLSKEARRYANKVMSDSNLCIVLMDQADIAQIATNPVSVVDVFGREAKHAMKVKSLDGGPAETL